MWEPDSEGVYARISASAARRLFAVGVLYALGGLLIYLALSNPPTLMWQLFLIVLGALVLYVAETLRRATKMSVLLTKDELRDSNGRVLARVQDIKSVERGVFAFKPSNGFSLVLHSKTPRSWAPGLYWSMGRRVGIGGVTPSGEAKFMAEQIAFHIAER